MSHFSPFGDYFIDFISFLEKCAPCFDCQVDALLRWQQQALAVLLLGEVLANVNEDRLLKSLDLKLLFEP